MGGEGLEAQLAGERQHAVLGRPDPLAADLDLLAVGDRLRQQPAPDPVARLQHRDRRPCPLQLARRDEAGEAGADDGHVCLELTHAA